MSNKFFDFINLHNGEEKREKVLETIKSNISFRGSNLWILACAIVIASVGLNVNSTAVIIGAMPVSYTHLDVYKRQMQNRVLIC